jgi:ketosteroid isomerase-like protein
MAALYEPDAILDSSGQIIVGREAIRAFYAALVATGRKFDFGQQRPAVISGDLAFTSTHGG